MSAITRPAAIAYGAAGYARKFRSPITTATRIANRPPTMMPASMPAIAPMMNVPTAPASPSGGSRRLGASGRATRMTASTAWRTWWVGAGALGPAGGLLTLPSPDRKVDCLGPTDRVEPRSLEGSHAGRRE